MDSRLPHARSKLSQSMTPGDESSSTDTRISILTEQMKQLLKDREEERHNFLTVLKQVADNKTRIDQQAAQIQNLNSTVTFHKRQIEEMQESVVENRSIRNLTIQKYKEEIFDPSPSFDPRNVRWQDAGCDGDALGDCCLYESGRRVDREIYCALYGLLPWEVRSLEKCEFLIRALSLRGTIEMDSTLSRGDKGNFAARVQSCHTGYVLVGRNNDAFDRDPRMRELKEEVLKEFVNLQQLSSKMYDRGIQMYPWQT